MIEMGFSCSCERLSSISVGKRAKNTKIEWLAPNETSMTLARTTVVVKRPAPKRAPTEMKTPDVSAAAENDATTSGDPLANARRVTPASVCESLNSSASRSRLGVKYFSAVDFRKMKTRKIITIYSGFLLHLRRRRTPKTNGLYSKLKMNSNDMEPASKEPGKKDCERN